MNAITPPSPPLPLYILAGGKSRRFGSDKARAQLDGKPQLLNIAEAFAPLASTTTAIAQQADAYDDLGVRTLADLEPDGGPVVGLQTALTDRREQQGEGWLLLASCDLVRPQATWVDELVQNAIAHAVAVVFSGDRIDPFPGLYHTALLETLIDFRARGGASMQKLIAAAPHTRAPMPAGLDAIPQANRRDALR